MTQQKSVIDWLKDAHAMEMGGVTTLSDHAAAARDYPEVQAKLGEHAEATRRHAELLEGRLERLGEGPSSLKEAVGAVFSKVAGVANLPASDTVVKNALGDFAAENFEIASYRSLVAAAEAVGDGETVSVCEQILRDEEAMAGWLEAQIPVITRQFLDTQTGAEGGGPLDKAKQTVRNLGEQAKAAAPDAGDTRNALLATGALLAGAGAALLIGKALRGGTEERPQVDAEAVSDAQMYPVAPSSVGMDGSGDQPLVPSEPTASSDLAETVQPVDTAPPLGEADVQAVPDEIQSQEEIVAEMLGGDAEFLLMSEPQPEAVIAEVPEPEPALHDGSQDAAATPGDVGQGDAEVWLVPGPFSGLGPQGYDAAGGPLGAAVYERLTQHGHVDATHIEITLEGDQVRLGGPVDSEATKRLAVEAVRSVPGVGGVEDLLEVQMA